MRLSTATGVFDRSRGKGDNQRRYQSFLTGTIWNWGAMRLIYHHATDLSVCAISFGNQSRWLHIPALVFLLVAWSQPAGAKTPSDPPPFGAAKQTGRLANRLLREASGVAASPRSDDVLWALNDSGNDPLLFAIGKDGKDLGSVRIADVPNLDWEDLTSFTHNGKPYLLIADTGDNQGARDKCYLHIIEEPDLASLRSGRQMLVKRAWAMAFRYDDGPRDCESVAVLPASKQIVLVSKRDVPANLYTLPLVPEDPNSVQVARKVATLDQIPQPKGVGTYLRNNGRYAAQPTAMDITSDGSAMAVLTYVGAYYWSIHKDEDIASALGRDPIRIPLPFINQAEGLCFSRDGNALWIVAEATNAPLHRLERTPSR